MKQFYGNKKKKNYFEGWYLKQQTNNYTIAFIPSFHISKNGKKSACLQVITKEGSYHFSFPENKFKAYTDYFCIKIGSNLFTKEGILINLTSKDICIKGTLYFGEFLPPKYNIMGPFQFIPFLQCRHDILSLSHHVYGRLTINNQEIKFENGTGYIEKDRGCSFPSSYLWTQTNSLTKEKFCIMIAAAKIPITCFTFTGSIICIYYKGKQYQLATYLGAKVLLFQEQKIVIQQRKFLLIAELLKSQSYLLKAPQSGKMSHYIKESPVSTVQYQLYYNNHKLFDIISKQASFEFFQS